jgi:4-oxalocrotonate tautomerase
VPLIQVTMVQGRTVAQKHALIRSLTDAMHETTGTPRDRIRVAIYEISADEWGIGGEPFAVARAAGPDATAPATAPPATSSSTTSTTSTGGSDS